MASNPQQRIANLIAQPAPPSRHYSQERVAQHFPLVTDESLEELMQPPGLHPEIHALSHVFDEEWKRSTVELAMAECDRVMHTMNNKIRGCTVPLWKLAIRIWRISPMYILGSYTGIWLEHQAHGTRSVARGKQVPHGTPNAASQASAPTPCRFTWTDTTSLNFRNLLMHSYWSNQPWLLPVALEWASICSFRDKRPWTAPTVPVPFFGLLYSVSRQHPNSTPKIRLQRVGEALTQRGALPCPYYDLFSHILDSSRRKNILKAAPELSWEPKFVGPREFTSVAAAVEAVTAAGSGTSFSCQDYLKAFDEQREGNMYKNSDAPRDMETMVALFRRSIARDILAVERIKKLHDLGWPLEKIRFLFLHPKLRTAGCAIAGPGREETIGEQSPTRGARDPIPETLSDDIQDGVQDGVQDDVQDDVVNHNQDHVEYQVEDEPMNHSVWEKVSDVEMADSGWETTSGESLTDSGWETVSDESMADSGWETTSDMDID
ncbi:hypothetical protein PG984_014526 [Apiospora sp. TS-2023a]